MHKIFTDANLDLDEGDSDDSDEESLENENKDRKDFLDEDDYDDKQNEYEESDRANILKQFFSTKYDYLTYIQYKFCTRIFNTATKSCSCIYFAKKKYCVHSLVYETFNYGNEASEDNKLIEKKPKVKQKNKRNSFAENLIAFSVIIHKIK